MHHELLLKGITHSTMGVAIMAMLLVLLVGLRRESNGGEPIGGIVHLGIVVMGVLAFLALMVTIYSAKRMIVPEKNSQPVGHGRV
jgi:Na+-transporting methylmalonyl-CoA/oxaloacetate decarboxylase gamma subunit